MTINTYLHTDTYTDIYIYIRTNTYNADCVVDAVGNIGKLIYPLTSTCPHGHINAHHTTHTTLRIHTRTYVHASPVCMHPANAHTPPCEHTCMSILLHLRIGQLIHTSTRVCMSTYSHTHTHTRTYALDGICQHITTHTHIYSHIDICTYNYNASASAQAAEDTGKLKPTPPGIYIHIPAYMHTPTHSHQSARIYTHACGVNAHEYLRIHLHSHAHPYACMHRFNAHIHVCKHPHPHTHAHSCIHMQSHTNAPTHTDIHKHPGAHSHARIYMHSHATTPCHIRIHMHATTYRCTYTKPYDIAYDYLCMHMHTYTHTRIHMHTHANTHAHLYARQHPHAKANACTYLHSHAYTNTCSYTPKQMADPDAASAKEAGQNATQQMADTQSVIMSGPTTKRNRTTATPLPFVPTAVLGEGIENDEWQSPPSSPAGASGSNA